MKHPRKAANLYTMSADVTEYLNTLGEQDKAVVSGVYSEIHDLVPDLVEGKSYGMPCLLYRGKAIASIMVCKNWLALYPYSGKAIAAASSELKNFTTTTGSVHFTADKPLPKRTLKAIITARKLEIDGAL
jgi:uncharacterized protein YdhG (YjbR/CyaY superfamily)